MRRSHRTTFLVLISVAALLCASMLAPAFGAPQATSAASLAKKLASTLRIAKRADRNAKRAIKGLQVEGKRGPAGPPGATGAQGATGAKGDQGAPATRLWAVINASGTTAPRLGRDGEREGPPAGTRSSSTATSPPAATRPRCRSRRARLSSQPRSRRAQRRLRRHLHQRGAAADKAFHLAVFC